MRRSFGATTTGMGWFSFYLNINRNNQRIIQHNNISSPLSLSLSLSSSSSSSSTTNTNNFNFNTNTNTDDGRKRQKRRFIRLSKRMGELDMFSRREGDRMIMNGRILVDGKRVKVGEKIPFDLEADRIEIINNNDAVDNNNNNSNITAVVLNKPVGFVSGHAEHAHPPAIRLLTPKNRILLLPREEEEENDNDNGLLRNKKDNTITAIHHNHPTNWIGFAPAGRLDINSTGLLVITNNGVLAKKLIGSLSCVEKEYIVDVVPAQNVTKREYDLNPNFRLPSRCFDLTRIIRGGDTLLGNFNNRPLQPARYIRWIQKGKQLQIILTEGRKNHIRRMCRELLGWHVVKLQRIRIGPIQLLSSLSSSSSLSSKNKKGEEEENNDVMTIPEGCWRQLRQQEIESLLATSISAS